MIRKTRVHTWEGDFPQLGNFLKTKKGSVYMVLSSVLNTRPNAKSIGTLTLQRLFPDEIDHIPKDALIFDFKWGDKKT